MNEELKRSICPKLCKIHKTSVEMEQECKNISNAQFEAKFHTRTKMKASENEGFISPTKTSKQPRKEKFTIPISNPFEVLTNVKEVPAPLKKRLIKFY
ncbi:hypothetical protein NPIL_75301 [Nephila pilipes]|uniref:Uncharacterized protein n=1 Tax=Nephila pilipes TaxID=299642 RepID=A0A8X6PPM4_NEPPI|nr:hypothetical protein NPIL_75301 [Nephila pilipes]